MSWSSEGGGAVVQLPPGFLFCLSVEAPPEPIVIQTTASCEGGRRVLLGGLDESAEVGWCVNSSLGPLLGDRLAMSYYELAPFSDPL